jgi:hypothetical protein
VTVYEAKPLASQSSDASAIGSIPILRCMFFGSCFLDWVGDCTDASEETREFALAHVKRGVAGAYRHRTAVENYCNGDARPDNVIPLKRTA